jgi:hypothetical protein
MRQQKAEISMGRPSHTARRDTSDQAALGLVTEFLGIGVMFALLLLS